MKIIDISWPITPNITEYKDKSSIKIDNTKKFDRDGVREKTITMNSHTGTHVDFPSHFLKSGKTSHEFALEKLIGNCRLLDLSSLEEKITEAELKKFDIKPNEILLFKTKNSSLPNEGSFLKGFVYLDKSGAQYCVEKKVKSVGIDYLGIERNQPLHETHKILLKNEVLIIEGLRLSEVEAGTYEIFCLPMFFIGIDSSFARAILVDR